MWTWVNGEGESWERSRVPLRYWSAWAVEFWPAGATVRRVSPDSTEGSRKCGRVWYSQRSSRDDGRGRTHGEHTDELGVCLGGGRGCHCTGVAKTKAKERDRYAHEIIRKGTSRSSGIPKEQKVKSQSIE